MTNALCLSQTSDEHPTCARLTLLRCDGFIGKRFYLDDAGCLDKEASGQHTEFIARQFDVGNAFLMKGLVEEMSSDMALVFGVAPNLPDQFELSARGHRRNQETFSFQSGPGWLLLDYDTDQMPIAVRNRIAELGGPLAAMEHVWPELLTAGRVFKPSSSSGVFRKGDEPPARFEGFHLYVLVKDQQQSAEILKALEARAWAEGLGWIKVSKSGSQLVRSIFDTTVGAPERLVFAGPPKLDEGVGRVVFPLDWQEGNILEAPSYPETQHWQSRIAEAKRGTRVVAKKVERQWKKAEARKSMALGVPARAAIKAVKARQFGGILTDDAVLDLNDGSRVKVGDLLDRGPPPQGKLSLPSPLDGIDYGRGKATLLWQANAEPIIVDHAHGGRRRFIFARYASSGSAQWQPANFFDVPDISAKSRRQMMALLQKADNSNARDRVIAVSKRLFWSVPAEWCLADMLGWIRSTVAHCSLSADFWRDLEQHLGRWLQARRAAIATIATYQPNTVRRHKVMQVSSLVGAVADLPEGVLLVQAPLGAGKTQHIGAPLVARAKGLGLSVMAICHRVTLTTELSNRLTLAHYQNASHRTVAEAGGVAVCLPSINRDELRSGSKYPDVVFVDEIRQVIDFLTDTDCFKIAGASAQDIFDSLTEVIKRARTVIAADAHLNDRTIEFLERCRPGEAFTILTLPPSVRTGRVEFRYGAAKSVRSNIMDTVIAELVAGGKVWIACESRELAEALDKYLTNLGFSSIAITASNKMGAAQRAFLSDADGQSRNFDVVVSSPAISSGISIEHRQGPHFTLGVFIGGGHAILPTDAVQQIGRVRYLERIVVGVIINNLRERVQAASILQGRGEALDLQQTPAAPDDYAKLAALVEAEGRNARADFAAALYWLLEKEGWCVTTSVVTAGSSASEEARAAALHEKLERLNATPLESVASVAIDLDAIKSRLRYASIARDDVAAQFVDLELRLEAARIRETLGVTEILHEDYKLWDGGRLQGKIAFFESLVRVDEPPATGLQSAGFWLVDLGRARWRLYRELFDGIDIRADGWLTPSVAEKIIDRVMVRPEAYAAVGIVGPKFYTAGKAKDGGNAAPKRPASATKAVGEILGRAGLALRGEQRRMSQMGPVPVNTAGAKCDSQRVRVYSTTGFSEQADLLRLRELRRRHIWEVARPFSISLRQLSRSLARLLSDVIAALNRLISDDDGHQEAYQ